MGGFTSTGRRSTRFWSRRRHCSVKLPSQIGMYAPRGVMTVRHAPSSFFQAIPMIDFQAPCVFPVASNPGELPKGLRRR
jgi:hypothetical protein